ncbi:hypothetical protein NLU13_7840 [Sarocladium strictum]|uniref:Uncharacterized protein n=1 Tax=Sarocladium strictum TaxID=5046 RepID=A0AA39GE88_SARSR|nr:hypothetical protein NLU13_7840 [Sarocladium strictum]
MDRPRNVMGYNPNEAVVMEDVSELSDAAPDGQASGLFGRTPRSKARSLSDSGGTPSRLSPSPLIIETSRRTSKDDSNLRDLSVPVTPQRQGFFPGPGRGLALNMPARAGTPPPAGSNFMKPAPLSPKLDHSQIYASPTNILPRRSRGLDFSRAATSLHHSTLAEQSSPDSSPTMGGRAMNIPGRRPGEFGGPEQTSSSLWSIMGNQERLNISGSLGSAQAIASDSSSSDDDDMDEDMEDSIMTTPQMSRASHMGMPPIGAPFGSPAMSSLMSFQQRQRSRKHNKKKARGPLGFGYNSTTPSLSKSPPQGLSARRESISWQANQLHISGADSDENVRNNGESDTQNGDGRTIVRRVTSRRGNLLPKTKNFARIRAALAEETAPADTDVRHEAEVIKQVRESDPVPEARVPAAKADAPATSTVPSSPSVNQQDSLDDIPEDDMMGDLAAGLSSSFKQQAMKNTKGKNFWETFSESSSMGGARTTPPPSAFLPRGSSSGVSEDLAMDSPSMSALAVFAVGSQQSSQQQQPPSAAEITRRINKRRRDDSDLDPVSFKRRAVSPGFSVHNSPILQSPLQREAMPWGSRPGSNGGDRGTSSAQSESGSVSGGKSGGNSGKGRIGFQGMVDTNDGIMRMSIE